VCAVTVIVTVTVTESDQQSIGSIPAAAAFFEPFFQGRAGQQLPGTAFLILLLIRAQAELSQ
jgi:hypothetical protein